MYKRATVDMTNVFCGNKFCSIECVLVGLVPAGGPMELMLKMGPNGQTGNGVRFLPLYVC